VMLLLIAVTTASVSIFAAFVWAVRYYFASPAMPGMMKLLSAVGLASAAVLLILLWSGPRSAGMMALGGFIQLAGGALFAWTAATARKARLRLAFDSEKPHILLTDGPYGFIRHPFYTSYALFWIGWALATAMWWAAIPVALLVAFYISAARREEQNFARSGLAAQYHAYTERSGAVLPSLKREE